MPLAFTYNTHYTPLLVVCVCVCVCVRARDGYLVFLSLSPSLSLSACAKIALYTWFRVKLAHIRNTHRAAMLAYFA